MRKRLGFIAGVGLSALGVAGMAGGGILWNFQGRTLGLGTTITSLVLIGISLVLLRPLQQEPTVSVPDTGTSINLQAPRASIIGVLLAVFGSFGLAASGIVWNFKGLAFGLTGTITSLVALVLSFIFLRPLASKGTPITEPTPSDSTPSKLTPSDSTPSKLKPSDSTPSELTPEEESSEALSNNGDQAESEIKTMTAEQIARSLAESQQELEPLVLSNFATDHLLAGQSLPIRRRRAGSSLKQYKQMAGELFKN